MPGAWQSALGALSAGRATRAVKTAVSEGDLRGQAGDDLAFDTVDFLDALAPSVTLPSGPWEGVGPAPIRDPAGQTGVAYGNVAGRISTVAVHPMLSGII